MHSFEMQSNESACRKSGPLGLEQVIHDIQNMRIISTNFCASAMVGTTTWWNGTRKIFLEEFMTCDQGDYLQIQKGVFVDPDRGGGISPSFNSLEFQDHL